MSVAVLPLRSFTAAPVDLDAATAALEARLRDEKEMRVVDPVRSLVEQGSDRWLEADHLLFSGMEAFGELRYADAVKALRASLEISQSTFREYADAQGPRRVRETCVYLALSRLEQGEREDAVAWFQRGARTDPAWRPDEKQFSPAARAAFDEARTSLAGPPMETSLERLGPMADRIGAEVLITGGVHAGRDGKPVVLLVIADRRRGESTEQSFPARATSRDELLRVVDAAVPQIVARILDRPMFSAEGRARRVRYDAGIEIRQIPGAALDAIAVTNRYRWRGIFSLAGIHAGISAMRFGNVLLASGVSFFPGQRENGGHFVLHPPDPSLECQAAFGASFYAMPTIERRGWTLGAGPGLEGTWAILVFRSQSSVAPAVPSWLGPAILASARHDVGRAGFVQFRGGAEYDLAGRAPGPLTIRAQLSAGAAF